MEEKQAKKDKNRDDYLASLGFKVLRFTSREVLKERAKAVAEVIYRTLNENLSAETPWPWPPFAKGGIEEKNPKVSAYALLGEGRGGGGMRPSGLQVEAAGASPPDPSGERCRQVGTPRGFQGEKEEQG